MFGITRVAGEDALAVLEFRNVVKRFGEFTAVDDLSFAVEPGQVFGFLGRNGAGKTTSMRMVLDILRPSSGEISVLGEAPGGQGRKRIGFLPEERGLYRKMTVVDIITYFGELKAMSRADATAKAKSLAAQLGLADWGVKPVEALSKGMAQKVQLACAIVNDPDLVLLDEPFSGLDPVSQGDLEAIVQGLAAKGATVIFSTHVMQHAERLCDRLLLVSQGRKVFEGDQAAARAVLPARISLSAKQDPRGLPMVAQGEGGAPDAEGWADWDLTLKAGVPASALLDACFERGLRLRRFDEHRPSLHDVFIHLAGDEPVTASERSAA
jgi:ABC-2 type transport system ATP-binding protein